MALLSYSFAFLLSLALILVSAYFAYRHYRTTTEMCCMMIGMAYGTAAGFASGTLLVLPNGDYLLGMIGGTAVGLAVGIPMGRWGGALGRMEGVMAGIMGGMMGAMTGLMVRPFDLQLFMLYFFIVVIVLMGEMGYVIYKQAKPAFPTGLVLFFALLSLASLAAPFLMDFSVF